MTKLPFDLVPFTKREVPVNSRIHTEFTDKCRTRMYRLIKQICYETEFEDAFNELRLEYAGDVYPTSGSYRPPKRAEEFFKQGQHEYLVEYIEKLYNIVWESDREINILLKHDSHLRRILLETRILLRLTPTHSQIKDMTRIKHSYRGDEVKNRYRPSKHGPITFEVVSSEAHLDADREVQKVTGSAEWGVAVEPYNEAWMRYQEEQIDASLFELLNKSLERVIFKICKEDNDWVADNASLGACLNELQNRGFFTPNDELYHEWTEMGKGLRAAMRKTGADKHRHEDPIQRDYAILVLHQVAAFLTFLIRRYESEYADGS